MITTTCDTAAIYATTDESAICIDTSDNVLVLASNNFPEHGDNYNQPMFTLTPEDAFYTTCAFPAEGTTTELYAYAEPDPGCSDNYVFALMLNGVRLDPNAAVVYENADGTDNYAWHLEATSTHHNIGRQLGTVNGGHLNPFGAYHYHGVPEDYFVNDLGIDGTQHSPIVAYAADGYPVYYKYVFADPADAAGGIAPVSSGYSLKTTRTGSGEVPNTTDYPLGYFYEDYAYSTSNLDACNGRYGVTPEYPLGTYHYVITDNFPFIPRCFGGSYVDPSFLVGPNCGSTSAPSACAARVAGCMDPAADNYDAAANYDDGSCMYAPLPVEIVRFAAEAHEGGVLVSWATASTQGGVRFEVERADATLAWEVTGGVDAVEGQTDYSLLDGPLGPGSYYYRLVQVDGDGTKTYGDAALVELTGTTSQIEVFVDGDSRTLHILSPERLSRGDVEIVDAAGKVVIRRAGRGFDPLELEGLRTGLYVVRLRDSGGFVHVRRFFL